MALSFQHNACQSPGRKRAGIDIDPVGAHFRFQCRAMAMHDDLAEIHRTIEKFIADPQQILFALAV